MDSLIKTKRTTAVWIAALWIASAPARAQTGSATQSPTTVNGQVVDALTGAPIARALVRINARSLLTGADGRFSFPGFTDAQAYASVQKPGYTTSATAGDGPAMLKISDLTASVALRLYPDALVTGTVSGRDGQPLAQVTVQLMRANFDTAGLTTQQVHAAQTDSHGMFRFREPAGRYRVAVRYVPSMAETGRAVLPETFPSDSPLTAAGYFTTLPGQEKHVDLRPQTGLPEPVTLRLDGMPEERRDGLGRVSVRTSTGNLFNTEGRGTAQPGEMQIALPAGAYDLRVTSGGRGEQLEGQVHLTVGSAPATAAVHLAPLPLIPLEVTFEPTSTAAQGISQPPDVQQLNLQLVNLTEPPDNGVETRPRTREDHSYEFRVPAGRYRLVSTGSGAWTIRSAFAGGSNLMPGELNVSGSGSGVAIRLIASNATGKVTGTVALGAAPGGWLYLLPSEPRLTPYVLERVGTTGTYTQSAAPGNYTAVAVDQRLEQDFRDSRVIARIASHGKPVQVTDGGSATLNLDLQTASAVVQ